MTDWTNNEDGPDCACGNPTVVKLTNDGPLLLCLFHTDKAGASFELPRERPDDWPNWPRNEEDNDDPGKEQA